MSIQELRLTTLRYHSKMKKLIECLKLIQVAFQLCEKAIGDVRRLLADAKKVTQSISSRTSDLEKCYKSCDRSMSLS